MEATEEVFTAAATTTTTTATAAVHVVKGKRTKRQRAQSPIPHDFAALTTVSSSADGGGGDDEFCTSSNNNEFQDSKEEDHDMANCLILLAQGNSRDHSPKQDENICNINLHHNNNNVKFNSRRFLETASTGTGKIGYYVYECKTCNRTFPSFQALGGHRASHKKPKTMHNNNEDKMHFMLSSSSDKEEGHFKNLSSLSLQLISTNNNSARGLCGNHHNKVAKSHECSICGAEFTSGQALGGHMRRHRGPVRSSNNTTLSLTPMVIESEEPKKARNVLSLDLDLNLPAPAEEDKFAFASKQQQEEQKQQQPQKSPLVLSGPALVDCHY